MNIPKNSRIAVIGLGRMGLNHVKACADVETVELVAVYDQQERLTQNVSQDFKCLGAKSLEDLVGRIDCAIIAASTRQHSAIAIPLLEAGIACLIEKPIAVDEHDARHIIDVASANNSALAIGHIERFNPTIIALRSKLGDKVQDGQNISQINVRRLNLSSSRNYDVDSVLDLMIHDLDLMTLFMESDVSSITVNSNPRPDEVSVHLTYENGSVANLAVSRIAETQHRDLNLSIGNLRYQIDFSAKTLTEIREGTEVDLNVPSSDALRDQLRTFVDLTKNQESNIASGAAGLRALQTANRIRRKAGLL